jgi:hypothetical protein
MENIIPVRIQIVSIVGSLAFLYFIARLIMKGKLRAEYSVVWLVCTALLLFFSIWRDGLGVVAGLLGVFYPPSLVFMGAIFAVFVFLVHLSIVVSKLQRETRILAQELALLQKDASATKG